jgi:hypothetical protein
MSEEDWEIVYPDDFETEAEYYDYLQEHPEARTAGEAAAAAGGAHIEIGFSGIKIAGDYWFIAVVLVALPALLVAYKKINFHFAKKKALAEKELGIQLD